MAPLEGLADGVGIGVPAFQPLDIDPTQFPLLERVLLALQETPQLLRPPDVQPQLLQHDSLIHQHPLEIRNLAEEMLALIGRAEVEDVLHDAAIVPAPVEEHDFALGRQVIDVALEIPLSRLAVRRFRERDDPRDPRVEVLTEALDRAALTSRVAPLEDHDDALAAFLHVGLEPHELELKRLDLLLVGFLAHLVVIGVGVRQHVFLVRVVDCRAYLVRGLGLVERADRAVEGE